MQEEALVLEAAEIAGMDRGNWRTSAVAVYSHGVLISHRLARRAAEAAVTSRVTRHAVMRAIGCEAESCGSPRAQ
jgi:hypothetical protein